MSALIHSYIVSTVRKAKSEHPEIFPDHQPAAIVNESEFDRILYDAFDGRPIDDDTRRRLVESFEVERTRIVSPVEEMRLLAACDKWRKHLKPIIIFAIETGCRRGEMRALTWFDIDLAGRVIRVNGTSTKTLKSRLVPITARLADTLAQLRHNVRPKDSAAVFGMADWKKAFNSAAADAGLSDLRFHDLRHTAITRMLEKGISPPLVMKISGHTQQRTFMRYVNQSESSIYEIAMRLDRAA